MFKKWCYQYGEVMNRRGMTAVAVGLALTLSVVGCGDSQPPSRALEGKIDLQGHRGARGLRPENSLPAFEYAMAAGVTTLELDTHLSADGQLIVHHDSVVDAALCVDDKGQPAPPRPILQMTVDALKKIDCGSVANKKFPEQKPVPGTRLVTLPEFFDFVRGYAAAHPAMPPPRFNIEIKFEDTPASPAEDDRVRFAGLMVAAIERAGVADRTTVQSFAPEVLVEVKKRNPALKTAALFTPTRFQGALMMLGLDANRAEILAKARQVGANIVSPHHLYASAGFIRDCHEQGIAVVPWTVNDEDEMRGLLERGVDGIISDYPDRLVRVHAAWNKGLGTSH